MVRPQRAGPMTAERRPGHLEESEEFADLSVW